MRNADFLMNTTEEALVQNQSEVKPTERAPLSQSIAELIGVKTSAVAFADLRDAARTLGINAKRTADGKVRSVDPVDRAVFALLLARFAKHQPMKTSQLMELVGISKTQNADGSKATEGAFRFVEGKVKGEAASLGSLKLAPAASAGNVTLD